MVYIYTFATVTVHIYTITVAFVYHYLINFMFCAFFFSPFSSSSFSSDTHKHKHTHTQTQTHRQINTKIDKHTHTQTHPRKQTNRETDQCWRRRSVLVGWQSPCLWVLILVLLVGFLFLWWRLVLMVDKLFDHERKRKRKMLVEGGDLTMRKGRRRSLPWKEEERSRRRTKIGLSLWEMR